MSINKKELDEIYSQILEFACLNDNETLVKETLSIEKSSVPHNDFFKISCCKNNLKISNLFFNKEYTFSINDEIIEYASMINCRNLQKNTLNFYKKNNYKPNMKNGAVAACKNNSHVWINYYNKNFDFRTLNHTDIISILNVCNLKVCEFILSFVEKDKIKIISKNIINKNNKNFINRYLCSLVF